MSDEYTPTTGQIARAYADGLSGTSRTLEESHDEFWNWLTAHDAEVAAKAWDEGHDAGWNSRDDDAARGWVPSGVHESEAVNPYRKAVQS